MWLEELPPYFVECRSMRHAWSNISYAVEPITEIRERLMVPHEFNQVIRREAQCLRCETVRVEYFGRSQEVLRDFERFSTTYFYPDGYLWNNKQDEERPTFREINRELFRRVTG